MNVPANSLVSLTDVCSREELIHALYEAAELEHCLMCTYLYAAASLKSGEAEGLTPVQAEAVARWRQEIIHIAVEEMSHLAAVWNITSALGGAPRFGRANFPLDVGVLPADIVVKLAPFNCATLQHFIYLERPLGSSECEGEGFAAERRFLRGHSTRRLTPMSMDYEAVGTFYLALSEHLQSAATAYGEGALFCGNRKLQLSQAETNLSGAKPVFCSKTAVQAFHTIIEQGEGSSSHTDGSHFNRFAAIRTEFEALQAADPNFVPAHPAATNPVLRRPPRPEGRIWLENEQAIATVDLANACYGLMMRLLAYSYQVPGPSAEKSAAIDLGIGLMRACMPLAELAARLPAGPSNPNCNAGMSFTALRDAAAFPMEASSWQAFNERFQQLASAASALAADGNERSVRAAGHLHQLAARALRAHTQGFAPAAAAVAPPVSTAPVVKAPPMATAASTTPSGIPIPTIVAPGVEAIEGEKLTLIYEGKRCIHARYCVTGAPKVFIANVVGPWISPDAIPVERMVDIAHGCPSGAIRYTRKDGEADEGVPPVNLVAVREAGPYAVRGDIRLDGEQIGYRMTLCRCGASKNKPFCDGSHHEVNFSASGEPATGVNGTSADMLAVRDGVLSIDPEFNGPLQIRGNLEITAGTGRVVSRVEQARLCRCGASATKPFCDNSHQRIGFKST